MPRKPGIDWAIITRWWKSGERMGYKKRDRRVRLDFNPYSSDKSKLSKNLHVIIERGPKPEYGSRKGSLYYKFRRKK